MPTYENQPCVRKRSVVLWTRSRHVEKMGRAVKKKVCSCCEGFCGHAYSSDLIGHVGRTSEREEKSYTDLTNRHILELTNREEKKTKL